MLQANEALKVLLGIGTTLAGRLLLFDALETEFTELKLRRDPNCPVCSDAAVQARAEGHPLQVDGVECRGAVPADRLVRWPAREHGLHPGGPPLQRGRRQVTRARRRLDPRRRRRAGRASIRRSTSQLLTDDGDLNRFVNVYVNGQDVRYLAGLDTPVAPADEVRLLPAMAGG